VSSATHTKIDYFDKDDKPYGESYGQWTIKWWQWALSTPRSNSALIDSNGRNASIGQPDKDVWFLAGTIPSEEEVEEQHREITVPSGRAILFPIINCEANQLEYPELKSDDDLVAYVRQDENGIVKKNAFVNGSPIPAMRIASDPLVFNLSISDDNALRIKAGTTRASSDGYYVFLKPLPKGNYSIAFQGACEGGKLKNGADYTVNVV
jgi:hypothetical protein